MKKIYYESEALNIPMTERNTEFVRPNSIAEEIAEEIYEITDPEEGGTFDLTICDENKNRLGSFSVHVSLEPTLFISEDT